MHISDLEEFVELAESSNYSEAAERLYITQSTLSKHILRMEQELGVVLFDRSSRHVQLSECGAVLLPYAKEIVALERKYSLAISEYRETWKSSIRFGTINNITAYQISEILVDFQKQNPGYHMNIINGSPYEVYDLLMDDKVDLAFLRYTERTDVSGLAIIPFAEDEIVAACAVGHPLAGRGKVALTDLKNERFLLYSERSFMYDCMMDACSKAGFVPKVAMNLSRTENLIDLAARNVGIGFFMKRHVMKYLNDGISLLEIDPPYRSRIDVCYKKSHKLAVPSRAFIRFLAQWSRAAGQQSAEES